MILLIKEGIPSSMSPSHEFGNLSTTYLTNSGSSPSWLLLQLLLLLLQLSRLSQLKLQLPTTDQLDMDDHQSCFGSFHPPNEPFAQLLPGGGEVVIVPSLLMLVL